AAVGGPEGLARQLASTAPELFTVPPLRDAVDEAVSRYLESLSTETVDDWRAASRGLAIRVRTLDLLRAALSPGGITSSDKQQLATLYGDLADYRPRLDLSAADTADRPRPLLAAAIEAELAALRSWPVRRQGLVGLLVRALVAAWTETTAASPPVA